MSILLSRLCENTEKTYSMKLIAGRDGLENPVRWVHMIEDVEATGFIHGNELIFTTGIRQQGVDWLIGYVVNLRENGAVGLVVNIGPYITQIPSQVIVYCEKKNFPLFTMPWKERIIDVTYDFCHRIVSNEEIEMSIAAAFRNLIFFPENKNGYQSSMMRYGFHDENSYTIMAIRIKRNSAGRKTDIWKKYQFSFGKLLKKSPYPTCFFLQENSLIVIRQKSPPNTLKALAEALNNQLESEEENLYVGISSEGEGWLSIPQLYHEAVSAATAAKQHESRCLCYSDIGIYKLLFGIRESSILSDYVRSTLGTLIDYDAKNNSDYVKTLKYYLKNDNSVQQVAELMNVHRNTVNYKIKMIKEILGTELHEIDKMNYMLAFCVVDMLNAM